METAILRPLFSGILSLLLTSLIQNAVADDFLYFSSPGRQEVPAGLYGGPITTSASKQGQPRSDVNLQYGYHCRNGINGINLESIAADAKTSRILLHVQEEGDGVLSLYRGDLCLQDQCQNNSLEVLFDKAALKDSIGPFAYHDNRIYFIYQTWNKVDHNNKYRRKRIEIRRLHGCDSVYPVTTTTVFDIEECSRLVGVLAEEEYEDPKSRFYSAEGLNPVQIGYTLYLFTQLHIVTYEAGDEVTVNSSTYSLRAMTSDGRQNLTLHSEGIDPDYMRWQMNQLGGASYARGRLCWTAVDRILCGRFDNRRLRDVTTLLGAGDATEVCSGEKS